MQTSCNTFFIEQVRCPWGCSEFLHRANKLHMKDFLWYSSNYQMKCLQAPQGKHWTDFISPSFPSSCLILERFSCSPVVVMSDDGPMILSCRNHCEQSTKAYIHVPESPTGTIYTPNSNGFAPVTVRSRTYKFFKVSNEGYSTCCVSIDAHKLRRKMCFPTLIVLQSSMEVSVASTVSI